MQFNTTRLHNHNTKIYRHLPPAVDHPQGTLYLPIWYSPTSVTLFLIHLAARSTHTSCAHLHSEHRPVCGGWAFGAPLSPSAIPNYLFHNNHPRMLDGVVPNESAVHFSHDARRFECVLILFKDRSYLSQHLIPTAMSKLRQPSHSPPDLPSSTSKLMNDGR